jgi:hypothetical protein
MAGIFALWLVGKLLKWSFMVIMVTILILGAAAVVWLVFR